jgi:hypothetical protein
MDRGENLFAQNWVEQWKRNVRERGVYYRWGRNEPSLENARIFGVDLWSWFSNDSMWRRRMDRLNPGWAYCLGAEEELLRTAGDSVPQMLR